MYTLGYRFKPWTADTSIPDGAAILDYIRETAEEFGIDQHIRFGHRVTRAEWSSDDARWRVQIQRTGAATTVMTCGYLFMCSGYYSYRSGHDPDFPGHERFTGEIVHPQAWPSDLVHDGRRVVVIGSGATAMTLVPTMARTAEHVTMLQRSPTYVVARPDRDVVANTLNRVLPTRLAYRITRRKYIGFQQLLYRRTRTDPAKMKAWLIGLVRRELGSQYDVDRHFTPTYDPWDQRLCLLPNGDLFNAIRAGRVSVVTDRIETFTETGIRLVSGMELPADIIVTATGLQLVTLGEIDFVVDGEALDFSATWTYKGLAYSDVPNLASTFGYVNASWTLRADLTCEYVCRLLNHMDKTGTAQCTPRLRPADRSMVARPWIDGFAPGYMQRSMHLFPRQGDREPWVNPQNYRVDQKLLERDADR